MSAPEADARSRFGPTADEYVRSPIHATGADLPTIAAVAQRLRPARALDVATGGGHTALAIAPHCGIVIAHDLTREMLMAARTHIATTGVANVAYSEGDAARLPFADGAFGLVTCRVATHHFPDVPAFCRESARALGEGGALVIVDIMGNEDPALDAFLHDIEVRRDPSHARNLPVSHWRSILIDAGFTVDSIEPFRRKHDLEDWLQRQRVPERERDAIARDMRSASEAIRRHYAITPGGPRGVATFETDFAIITATRN